MQQRRGPTYRQTWIVLLWLLIGAAANVGVAWGQAVLYQHARYLTMMRFPGDWPVLEYPKSSVDRRWPTKPPDTWPRKPAAAWKTRNLLCTEISAVAEGSRFDELGNERYMSMPQHGLPLRSLYQWTCWDSPLMQPFEGGRLGLCKARWIPQGVDSLPVAIHWPGFALNTLFYAALAWGLWQAPLALRRQRRRRAGRCVRCAYDLKGLTVGGTGAACPECGAEGAST